MQICSPFEGVRRAMLGRLEPLHQMELLRVQSRALAAVLRLLQERERQGGRELRTGTRQVPAGKEKIHVRMLLI